MQLRLQNLIGRTSLVGQVVKRHPSNPRAYILADNPDADAYGTVAESVPNGYWGLVNLINTVSPNDIIPSIRTVIDTTTELITDYCIVCNKATAMSVYLLDCTGGGRVREIINIGTGVVTVYPSGDPSDPSNIDFIDGSSTITLNQWDTKILRDIGVNQWKLL